MSDKNIDWLKRLQILDKALEENGVRTNFCVDAFGKIGYRPDFSKHDKKFNDEIGQLNHELSDVQKSADEYYNKCIDLTNQIEKLKSELEIKADFETDRLVKLPFDALETANMLINATYKAEIPFLEKQVERNVYDIDDLEQIAEHLLVYCKHNRDDEE